jgi:hypothetical protein
MSDLTPLNLITFWVQTHVSLARRHTQIPWARLQAKLKHMWAWQDVRLKSLGLDYMLIPNTYESDKILDSTPLGSAVHGAQEHRV